MKALIKRIEQCLSLSIAQRYKQIIEMGEFLKLAREKESFADVRRAFKTIQILEQK